MDTKLITVVMAFRNSEKFLDESISSILNQTYSNLNLILINDASTDNSEKIINKYVNDKRILYIKNEDRKGKSFNLNKGILMSKSNLVAIMDGDDISEPTRIAEQVSFLEKNNDIAVVGTFVKIINQNGDIIDERTKLIDPEEIKNNLLLYGPLVQPSVMLKKDVFEKVEGYREKYEYGEDTDLWYRIVYSGFKISNIPKYLLKYRYHGNNVAHQSKKIALFDLEIKKTAIKKFNLKIGLKGYFFMYSQFLIEYFLSGRQRQWMEGTYKKLAFGKK